MGRKEIEWPKSLFPYMTHLCCVINRIYNEYTVILNLQVNHATRFGLCFKQSLALKSKNFSKYFNVDHCVVKGEISCLLAVVNIQLNS